VKDVAQRLEQVTELGNREAAAAQICQRLQLEHVQWCVSPLRVAACFGAL